MRAVVSMIPLALALLAQGCGRSTPSAPRPAAPVLAPRAVLQQLTNLRNARQYRELPPYIVPERGHDVVNVLMAVDEFLAANRRLCDWIRSNIGPGLADTIDQSYLGDELGTYLHNSMGIFARRVELLDQKVAGDCATVSFTVAGTLPAQLALLRRTDGRWLYDPERAATEDTRTAFTDMARGLEQALVELQDGRLPPAAVRDDPMRLVEKVKARLRRGVALLSKASAEAPAP